MQAVCDSNRKIRDIFIGYPGSVHDSRVFRNSPLYQRLEEKCGQYYLLGDSGYPLRRNLMTPFKDRGQLTQRQNNFNIKLSKNRCLIEQCFGILKQKFRQLYHIKLRNIVHINHLIRAACVLYNFSLEDEFMVNDIVEPPAGDDAEPIVHLERNVEDEDDRDARQIRDNIVRILRM